MGCDDKQQAESEVDAGAVGKAGRDFEASVDVNFNVCVGSGQMRKIVLFAFWAWFNVVACFAQELTISEASIVLKTVTTETQTSSIDGEELATTTREVSSIESTQKRTRVDVAGDSKKINAITIPPSSLQKLDDNSFLLLGKPGKYWLIVTSFDEGWQTIQEVEIGDGGDDPQPPPNDEVFNPGGFIMLVEETGDRTPAVAKITNNLTFWTSVKNRGYSWRFYDFDQANPGLKSWTKDILPALVFQHSDGKVWKAIPLPKSVSEIDAYLEKPKLTVKQSRWVQICPGNGQPCYWVEVTE